MNVIHNSEHFFHSAFFPWVGLLLTSQFLSYISNMVLTERILLSGVLKTLTSLVLLEWANFRFFIGVIVLSPNCFLFGSLLLDFKFLCSVSLLTFSNFLNNSLTDNCFLGLTYSLSIKLSSELFSVAFPNELSILTLTLDISVYF